MWVITLVFRMRFGRGIGYLIIKLVVSDIRYETVGFFLMEEKSTVFILIIRKFVIINRRNGLDTMFGENDNE